MWFVIVHVFAIGTNVSLLFVTVLHNINIWGGRNKHNKMQCILLDAHNESSTITHIIGR